MHLGAIPASRTKKAVYTARENLMKISYMLLGLVSLLAMPQPSCAMPTIYPTGVTMYHPDKCYNGYTLIGPSWWNSGHSTYLVDMNGEVMKEWPQLMGHSAKMLPNGMVQGEYGKRKAAHLAIVDWDGKVVRQYDKLPMSHDAQLEGSSVGYYYPDASPDPHGKILINSQSGIVENSPLSVDWPVEGNTLYEIDSCGNIVWQWEISQHVKELGLNSAAFAAVARYDKYDRFRAEGAVKKGVDWAHINAASYVGKNRWFDEDPIKYAAFNPEIILWSSRHISMIAIIEKSTGKIVWKLGPDYSSTGKLRKIGPIIGPHGSHIIPDGLPGAGNLLIYDNGGFAGYGSPDQDALDGVGVMKRHYSRVLEINPVTLDIVWEYSAVKAKTATANNPNTFFAPLQGSAQRLPNGNTLICEAADGRVFEVTPDLEIVWEYIDPKWRDLDNYNVVFRAYRVPYEWAPKAVHSEERAVIPPRLENFRLIPGKGGTTATPVLLNRK